MRPFLPCSAMTVLAAVFLAASLALAQPVTSPSPSKTAAKQTTPPALVPAKKKTAVASQAAAKTIGATTTTKTAGGEPAAKAAPAQAKASPATAKPQTPKKKTPAPLAGPPSPPPFTPAPDLIAYSEHHRDRCYHLQPAPQAASTKSATQPPEGRKDGSAAATGTKAAASPAKRPYTGGRCQPQSLIYARCRTGINTCRLGDTSPVQWFGCAEGNGNATALPVTGSVMVLAANATRGMPTGHPVYVEQATAHQDGTWTLRISHTNYDRRCHLDLDARVRFHPARMTASFETGPWGHWAKELKVLGFILR